VIIVFSVDGENETRESNIRRKSIQNNKSCIGNSEVQTKGTYDGCGCKEANCEWLIQQKSCPLACISKQYDGNKASEEDTVATVYYNVDMPKVSKVDEGEGTITLRFKISALWKDNRIKAKFTEPEKTIKLLPIIEHKEASIWNPFKSTFFWGIKALNTFRESSELSLNDGSELSNALELGSSFYANTTVLNMTLDTQMTLLCDFKLSSFPLDVQTCHFRMYSERVEQILLNMHTSPHSTKSYDDENFSLRITFVEESDGNAATLGFDIQLKRQLIPFLFKYYVPCIAIVLLSFISFIVPLTAIPGRVALLVTLFLTLTNTFMKYMVSITNIIFSSSKICKLYTEIFCTKTHS
jgi:hypothetical protein